MLLIDDSDEHFNRRRLDDKRRAEQQCQVKSRIIYSEDYGIPQISFYDGGFEDMWHNWHRYVK